MKLHDLVLSNLGYMSDTKLEIYDYEVPRMIAFGTPAKLIEDGYGNYLVKFFNGMRIYVLT